MNKNDLNELVPSHEGLGELITEYAGENSLLIYRECLYHWSHEEMEDYEQENSLLYKGNRNLDFGWCITGEYPIWGVSTYVSTAPHKEEE
tara:strand:+ start:726 stop:995 length:270 start_codon:yes stop_codon:yes gene_type:complete